MTELEDRERNRLILEWTFPWHVMDIMLGGKSAIDLNVLKIRNVAEAGEFIRAYGFDMDSMEDRRLSHALIIEALHLVETILMPKEWRDGNQPPDDILRCDDPRHLLLWASDDHFSFQRRGAWACALLTVIHTISYVESIGHYEEVEFAREQILGRFKKFIFVDDEAKLWLGVPEQKIELFRVDWKDSKSRESIILKLLHKRANIAETIHDLLGVRIVTRRPEDVMLVVKYLRQFYMVTFANTNPTRIRNTLIDVEAFKAGLEIMVEDLVKGRIEPDTFKQKIAVLAIPEDKVNLNNPHSAKDYRAIQMTCRQLIRMENPSFEWIKTVRRALLTSQLSDQIRNDLRKFIDFVETRASVKKNLRYSEFFNFEVQIMDEQSYHRNSYGTAAHDKYKSAQVKTARRRVLFEVLGTMPDSD